MKILKSFELHYATQHEKKKGHHCSIALAKNGAPNHRQIWPLVYKIGLGHLCLYYAGKLITFCRLFIFFRDILLCKDAYHQ